MVFSLEKAPHLAAKRSTRGIMLELSAVLMVLFIYSMSWYFVKAGTNYGVQAILILIVSLVSSVGADAIWALPRLWDKKIPDFKTRAKNFGLQIVGSYGYVSGIIFTLLIPIGTPLYVVFVGAFIGTFCAKCLFGGFGKNVFNPAVVGRVLVQISFPSSLKSYLGSAAPDTVATGATIMTTTDSLGWTTNLNGISLLDMFLGNYRGALGETFAFLILLALAYLIIRDIIDWRIPTFYLVTFFLINLFIGVGSGLGGHSFEFALRGCFIGGALFGSVFCLTDPVTAPTSRAGKCIYAVSAAVITALIRYQAAATEGVAFSILIVNMCAPLISKLLKSKSNKKLIVKSSVITGIALVGVIFGVVYGVNNPTKDEYKSGIGRYDSDSNLYSLVINTAKSSAKGYTEISDATMDAAKGTINSKVNFTMDNAPAAYYELSTNSALSYGYAQDKNDVKGTYIVTFGVIVTSNGTVGYKYLSGTENALGLEFAQQLTISQDHPYLKGDFDDTYFNVDTTQSGATTGANSTKTIPAIKAAILGAEEDFGLDVADTNNNTTNLNKILTAQNIATLSDSNVTVETNPAFDADSVGTCSLKLDGFKINSKDATYYEVTTPEADIENETAYMKVGVLVNSDGVVGLVIIKTQLGTGVSNLKSLASKITISNPFKSTDSVGTFGDVSFAGASIYTGPALDGALKACLKDVNKVNLNNLNSILTNQNITNLTADDITEETVPSFSSSVGTCSLKVDGFKINTKDACYYEVTTPDADYGEEIASMKLGILVNTDGIVGFKLIDNVLGGGLSAIQRYQTLITISNPFKSTDSVGTFGNVSFSGGSEYTQPVSDGAFKACISDFNGGK